MPAIRHPFYTAGLFKIALKLAAITPFWLGRLISSLFVFAGYPLATAGRAVVRSNLGHATGLRGAALEKLCRQNIFNFGRMLADYFCATRATPAQIGALLADRRGLDRITAARAEGRGVILVTAHLGNWELGAILLASIGEPVTVVTLEEPTSDLSKWREDYRRRLGIKTITIGSDKFAFVEIINALKRNEFVALLAERPYGDTGIPVQFFGRETQFSIAPALLWKHTGAVVLPVFIFKNDGNGYVSLAEPPVAMTEAADSREALAQNTQRIATAFEKIVRQHPEQWFNYAPVWETAPAGNVTKREPETAGSATVNVAQ